MIQNKKRMLPVNRRMLIKLSALSVAKRVGFLKFTQSDVASQANVSRTLVSHYWDDTEDLRRSVAKLAASEKCPLICNEAMTSREVLGSKLLQQLADVVQEFGHNCNNCNQKRDCDKFL